jgi:hypothetical protein
MGGGSKQPAKQEVVQGLPDEAKPYLYGTDGILSRAQGLSMAPLQLPDKYVAGLTGAQNDAAGLAQGGLGSYMPALTAGMAGANQGMGALGQGLGIIPGQLNTAASYQQNAADTGAGATQGYDPNSYQQYMNPYMDQVVQNAQQNIADLGNQQQQKLSDAAIGGGAFGGSRQALERSMLNKNIMKQQADTGSNLRAQGFQNAQQAAQSAFESQQQRQANYAGQLGALGSQYGQLGLSGAQTMGQLGQGLGSLGSTFANMGQLGQQMNVQDINTLLGIGGMQQGQDQSQLDATYANQYKNSMTPYQQLGFFSDIFQGAPVGNVTQTLTPAPSIGSQIAGVGMGLYGMNQMGKT